MAIHVYIHIHVSGIIKSLCLFDQSELFSLFASCQLLPLCAIAYSGNAVLIFRKTLQVNTHKELMSTVMREPGAEGKERCLYTLNI